MTEDGKVTAVVVGGTGGDNGKITTQEVVTTAGQPNVSIKAVPTALALLFGFLYQFLTVLVAVLTAAGMGNTLIPFTTFTTLFRGAASVAFVAGAWDLVKNLIVIVAKLKERYPLLGV